MKPEVKNINVAQVLITIALLVVLFSLLSLYIYYGMYQARQVAVPVVEEPTPVAVDSDEARRQEIINALEKESVPPDDANRRVIIKSLEQESVEVSTPEDEARRAEIIKALEQN